MSERNTHVAITEVPPIVVTVAVVALVLIALALIALTVTVYIYAPEAITAIEQLAQALQEVDA